MPRRSAHDDHHEPTQPKALDEAVSAAVAASGRKIVALDDDPTGVQTVHGVNVLADWSVPILRAEHESSRPAFFILTNARSVPAGQARRLNAEIAGNLLLAARQTGAEFVVASRSDSTLRGHYPAETEALAEALGKIDAVLLCPAFFEGGRVTIDDVHYVRDGDRLVPAAETEFARDAAFGYRSSNLRQWIAEKTDGRIAAGDVASVSLADIRMGGPDRVARRLADVGGGRPVIINAERYDDLAIVTLGLLQREAAGQRFLYRTAASFVRARAGIQERSLLRRDELLGTDARTHEIGLVVVGSHINRSSAQLSRLLELPRTTGVEIDAARLLESRQERERVVREARQRVDAAVESGETPVLFTSRRVQTRVGTASLQASQIVSSALVDTVASLRSRPAFIVAKGGITASDIGTRALGVRIAEVLGQIEPGVPVWRLGPETRLPEAPYVVFPGNVGGIETLAQVVVALRGDAAPNDR